jgi:ribosomal protein S18 acetylase RimI-like enzyme
VTDYRTGTEMLSSHQLRGFFVGWPNPPTPDRFLSVLRGSSHVVTAWDDGRLVGFVNALSDGTLTAYLPLLEVLPTHQGQGIGSELVRRMLALLDSHYAVDVVCDEDLAPFYERFGLVRLAGMAHRNYPTLEAGA